MKDLLIIFIVLLVLLLMISSFGGSLRYTDYIKPIENQIVGQEMMTCRGRDEKFTQDEDSDLLFNNNINNVNNGNIGNVMKTVIDSDQFKKQIPSPQKEIPEPIDISPYDNSSDVYETL